MNAEDCAVHRDLIDRAEANGIYYPWTCECPEPDGCSHPEDLWEFDPFIKVVYCMACNEDLG